MASSFRTKRAAKLGTVGEYAYMYLWDKLLKPVVLDSLCELVPSCGADG